MKFVFEYEYLVLTISMVLDLSFNPRYRVLLEHRSTSLNPFFSYLEIFPATHSR